MFVEEPPINNEDKLKNEILRNLCYKLTENIQNNQPYCNFLIKNRPLHEKLLITLNDAIVIHEVEEKYELCGMLFNFKNTIIDQNNN